MTDLATRTPPVLTEALDAVQNPDTPIEDRAALYGFLYELQRRINRALGIRQRGATAQSEITAHLIATDTAELGPLFIKWEAFDVEYPCNRAENWTDATVQEGMAALRDNPETRDFVREIPAHLEIDVAALGQAVHDGSLAARGLFNELKDKGWRTEGGKRAALRVREARRAAA